MTNQAIAMTAEELFEDFIFSSFNIASAVLINEGVAWEKVFVQVETTSGNIFVYETDWEGCLKIDSELAKFMDYEDTDADLTIYTTK